MRTKAIHFWKQLIYCWIFLWTCSIIVHSKPFSVPYCIDFVNVDDWRSWLFSFFEKVFYSFRAHSYIYLAKFWSITWKERDSSFSGCCFGKSCFSCTWRPVKNDSSSHFSPNSFINLRIFHVVYDFLERLFTLFKSNNILKSNLLHRLRASLHIPMIIRLRKHVNHKTKNRP